MVGSGLEGYWGGRLVVEGAGMRPCGGFCTGFEYNAILDTAEASWRGEGLG